MVQDSKKRSIRCNWRILFVLLFIFLALPFFFRQTTVNGDSMQPALQNGDHVLIEKFSYLVGDPRRFDVVVFSYQYRPNTYYIKRVIGLPGDTIHIREDGVIYVNGSALIEHYGVDTIEDAGLAENEITLGEDEYFVLGDHRNSSVDSRDPGVGNIKRSNIVGKGWICYYPAERMGIIE